MSLKGWQFLDDKTGEVQASYLFKDCILTFYKKVSEEREKEILDYLKEQKEEILGIEYRGV